VVAEPDLEAAEGEEEATVACLVEVASEVVDPEEAEWEAEALVAVVWVAVVWAVEELAGAAWAAEGSAAG